MLDLHTIGGTQVLLKHLLTAGVLHGDCITVTGHTLAVDLAAVPEPQHEQELLAPIDAPLKPLADMQICKHARRQSTLPPAWLGSETESTPPYSHRRRNCE